MPEILIDGKKVTVDPNTNLVEAGLKVGVPIPVFCYHKDLGAVGSCRVCACTVTGSDGKPRTVMACMTAAVDGMQVTTLDQESVALRKSVIEWLMLNHPHDCPICDEGGECQLQDLTIAGGHSQRRIDAPKRTFENQFLGEFIVHEMNRCIACYRCSRFYQEYAGGRDFGVSGSRDRVYFGRFEDGPFESPFSGNLVEMCPTGVFTDKLFRYKSRVWDLEIAPSVCPHCSVGCNVLPGARHRELQRVRVRENAAVNGSFMCDRGQFGHAYVMDPARPRSIRVGGETGDWPEALGMAGGALLAIAREHGAASIALVTSPRASVETHLALEALASGPLAGAKVAHFDEVERESRAVAALNAVTSAGCEPLDQGDIEHCDVLLIAGTSLVDEAPMAALAARQVARRGGKVFVVGPIERYLNDEATVIPTPPGKLAGALEAIAGKLGGAGGEGLDAAAAALGKAQRPGILLGSDLMDGPAFTAGAALAKALHSRQSATRFGCLFPGPNGFGAAAASTGANLGSILADLTAGKLRAAVLVECEVSSWDPKAIAALRKLDQLTVLDYLAGTLHDAAHVFLPTTVTYESQGCYVNRGGRLQAFAPALTPGLSVRERVQGEDFPRDYRVAPPESAARMAWEALEGLREAAAGQPRARSLGELRHEIARTQKTWAALAEIQPGSEGTRLASIEAARAEVPAFAASGDGLAVYRMDRTLGSELLSSLSAPIRKMAGPAVAYVSPADAQKLGIKDSAALTLNGATIEVAVRVHATVAPGTLLLARDAKWPASTAQGAITRIAALATA
jgi:NADH-quinone oxidoreductase subunit G